MSQMIPPVRFPVLVVGDCMLDRYWEGRVDRISPEAPVPVLSLGRQWDRAGGAANVAMNLAYLKCDTTLVTLLGEDEAGHSLTRLLSNVPIHLKTVRHAELSTIQKIRAVCQHQQLLRMDIEQPVPEEATHKLTELVKKLMPHYSWVLFSDYAKGTLRQCEELLRYAQVLGCHVLVDPKGKDFRRYRGAWLLKPNEQEAAIAAGIGPDAEDFDAQMNRLRQSLEVRYLLVTRGARGMTLYCPDSTPLHVAAQSRDVFDVSGAGDTVLATLAWGLLQDFSLLEAVQAANRAAGIVVGKFGTSTVSLEELSPVLAADKTVQKAAAQIYSKNMLPLTVSNKKIDGLPVSFYGLPSFATGWSGPREQSA